MCQILENKTNMFSKICHIKFEIINFKFEVNNFKFKNKNHTDLYNSSNNILLIYYLFLIKIMPKKDNTTVQHVNLKFIFKFEVIKHKFKINNFKFNVSNFRKQKYFCFQSPRHYARSLLRPYLSLH